MLHCNFNDGVICKEAVMKFLHFVTAPFFALFCFPMDKTNLCSVLYIRRAVGNTHFVFMKGALL